FLFSLGDQDDCIANSIRCGAMSRPSVSNEEKDGSFGCMRQATHLTPDNLYIDNKQGQRNVICDLLPLLVFYSNDLLYFLFLQVEAFAETLNTPGSIKDTLLAGEEWMA